MKTFLTFVFAAFVLMAAPLSAQVQSPDVDTFLSSAPAGSVMIEVETAGLQVIYDAFAPHAGPPPANIVNNAVGAVIVVHPSSPKGLVVLYDKGRKIVAIPQGPTHFIVGLLVSLQDRALAKQPVNVIPGRDS